MRKILWLCANSVVLLADVALVVAVGGVLAVRVGLVLVPRTYVNRTVVVRMIRLAVRVSRWVRVLCTGWTSSGPGAGLDGSGLGEAEDP